MDVRPLLILDAIFVTNSSAAPTLQQANTYPLQKYVTFFSAVITQGVSATNEESR
jgi:hypothetical protein